MPTSPHSAGTVTFEVTVTVLQCEQSPRDQFLLSFGGCSHSEPKFVQPVGGTYLHNYDSPGPLSVCTLGSGCDFMHLIATCDVCASVLFLIIASWESLGICSFFCVILLRKLKGI